MEAGVRTLTGFSLWRITAILENGLPEINQASLLL
jgi:hypothetical protein